MTSPITAQMTCPNGIWQACLDARLAAGLTQAQVAARMGCSQAKVTKLEARAPALIKLGDLLAYAYACGIYARVVLDMKVVTIPRPDKLTNKPAKGGTNV